MPDRSRARRDGHHGRPHFGPMPSLEREIRDFETDVHQRSQQRLVLAEFWAPWCTACTRLHPALEQVVARRAGRVELASVNIEMHADLVGAEGVHGMPLVKAYLKGRAIGEMAGVLPEADIERWVESLFDAAREGGLLAGEPR